MRVRWALVGLAGAGALAGPGTALGCSLVPTTEAERYARADAVFAGTVVAVEVPADPLAVLEPVTWTVRVEEVARGGVAGDVRVTTGRSGATCGVEGIVVGDRLAVFARADAATGALSVGLGDTRDLRPGEPVPRYARRGWGLAGARGFRGFPLFWSGEALSPALRLSQIVRHGPRVSFLYGVCGTPGAAGCGPSLEVQVARTCRATVPVAPLANRRIWRRVLVGNRGGGRVLFPGRVQVTVFGAGPEANRASALLTQLNPRTRRERSLGMRRALAGTVPGAAARVPCV